VTRLRTQGHGGRRPCPKHTATCANQYLPVSISPEKDVVNAQARECLAATCECFRGKPLFELCELSVLAVQIVMKSRPSLRWSHQCERTVVEYRKNQGRLWCSVL
jgi:hypothetical protein